MVKSSIFKIMYEASNIQYEQSRILNSRFIFAAVLTIALIVRTVTWLPSSSMSTQITVLPCSQNSSAN